MTIPTTETVSWSNKAATRTVVVAPSLNIETTASISAKLFEELVKNTDGFLIVPGQKHTVKELTIYDAPMGGKAADVVTLITGYSQTIPLGHRVSEGIAAGSSANIANTIRELGVQDIGIIGAIGKGGGGDALVTSLERRGFRDLLLVRRTGGSAQSLFLRAPTGETIAFAKKPPYEVSPEILAYLTTHASPRVLICSGFLEYELNMINALCDAEHVPEARVLSPHVNCFDTETGRRSCLELAKKADLFHLNQFEFARLLRLGGNDWAIPEDKHELITIMKKVEAKLVCVTCGDKGSVIYDSQQNDILRQSAFPVDTICNTTGAGDVHLAVLTYYLWLRGHRIKLAPALELATRICAKKIAFEGEAPRPWDGIPPSAERKPWVREAADHYHSGATPPDGYTPVSK